MPVSAHFFKHLGLDFHDVDATIQQKCPLLGYRKFSACVEHSTVDI